MTAEVEYCAFLCPFCYYTLSEMVKDKNIKPIMIVDLCKLAVGDTIVKGGE